MKHRLPVVEAFFAGDFERMRSLVESCAADDPLHLYYSALAATMASGQDNSKSAEAWQLMRQALDAVPTDPELFMLLLRYAIDLAMRLNKTAEAQQCLTLLKQLDDPQNRGESKTGLSLIAEAVIVYGLGDYAKAFEKIDHALRLNVAVGSVHWYRLKALRALYGGLIGHYVLAARDLDEMAAYPYLENTLAMPFNYMKAILCRSRGQFDEGLALLDALPEERRARIARYYVRLRTHLLLLSGRVKEGQAALDREQAADKKTVTPEEYENLRAVEALASHDLERVCVHARKAIAMSGNAPVLNQRWSMTLLLDAELAAGNAQMARSVLRMLNTTESPADQMYKVRLYILEGQWTKAAELFHSLAQSVEPEVIEEGLRFAYELKPRDVARLWMSSRGNVAEVKSQTTIPASVSALSPAISDDVLVGASDAIRALNQKIGKYAASAATVLIVGETGTGKEVVARLLHQQSQLASKKFFAVNCAAISDTLIEAELFGYTRGAFTGATHDHDGLFVAAGKGTLFLDEIEEMSPRIQAALLRTLEDHEVRPVGSTKVRKVEARVIAASNQRMEAAIEARTFRADLYFRLAQLHIQIPPLRERVSDIPLLVKHFMQRISGLQGIAVGEDLLLALQRHRWPGNVRELKNAIERIALIAGDQKEWHADVFAPDNEPETPPAVAPASTPSLSTLPAVQTSDAPVRATVATGQPGSSRKGQYARLRQLRALFQEHQMLTRADVVRLVGCAPDTATRDLELLETEGAIRRMRGPAAQRTTCFVHAPAKAARG